MLLQQSVLKTRQQTAPSASTQYPQLLGILTPPRTWLSAKPGSSAWEFDLPLHINPRHTTYVKTGKNLFPSSESDTASAAADKYKVWQ